MYRVTYQRFLMWLVQMYQPLPTGRGDEVCFVIDDHFVIDYHFVDGDHGGELDPELVPYYLASLSPYGNLVCGGVMAIANNLTLHGGVMAVNILLFPSRGAAVRAVIDALSGHRIESRPRCSTVVTVKNRVEDYCNG